MPGMDQICFSALLRAFNRTGGTSVEVPPQAALIGKSARRERRLRNGRTSGHVHCAMMDEAAMLDWRVTGEPLAEERRVGTKMIFAGDTGPLPASSAAVRSLT